MNNPKDCGWGTEICKDYYMCCITGHICNGTEKCPMGSEIKYDKYDRSDKKQKADRNI